MLFFLSASLFFVPFLTRINAYSIDPVSCKGKQYDLMLKAAEAAFDLANEAYAAIQPTPRDNNVQRLISLLFGDQADLSRVRDSLRRLQFARTKLEPEGRGMISSNQVMFYCDLERVRRSERLGQSRWIDSVTNRMFNDNQGETVETCKSSLDTTLAVTWNPDEKVVPQEGRFVSTATPSQVTLCPWFINWAVNEDYQVWNDMSLKVVAATAAIPLLTRNPFNYPLTPVDAFGLLERVILHELTHTTLGGKSEDVEMQQGGLWPLKIAYGWRATRNLVEQGVQGEDLPSKNADSIALFAMGIKLLGQETPTYIEDNGSLSKTVPGSSKRKVQSTLRYRSTPAAFEGFVKMIRETRADPDF
ncbi:hypothetical protein HII31_01168 [Pseudocercospora fuligena]|uniref:Lysine-specific metallo-endopeptidase domain-containing protein n=1 Tax=Pseudocercospora fuligena TaxID=685502 RepID=A0A8H6RU16_9PEZI|nr:hypothetical protein HII31_01168 [Pseudocercospora fuligena]